MSDSSRPHSVAPRLFVLLGALSAAAVAACGPTPAAVSPDAWAVVDSREITREDVEKAYRRTRDATVTLSNEETLTGKLSVLDDLILQDLLLAKAGVLKLSVTDTELDAAFNDGKKNMPEEAFQKELSRRGLTVAEMREGLRRELLTQKVVEQEVGSKIAVSDQEVTDAFNANRAQFNVEEESYHLAQIVVTPIREAQPANASGDDASTVQEANAKVQMLLDRLKEGAAFPDLAIGYSEDLETAGRGGDLGLVPVSRLKRAAPPMRDAVLNRESGSVNVASMGGAHTIVLVISHEPAGQRDLSTPEVKTQITDAIHARKDQLLRMAYIGALRTDAKVVNYLARRLVESKGVMPTLQPAAPGAK